MDTASAQTAAEAALEKGDYSFCIKIIEPLLSSYSAETSIGAQLRLLKVTAHMGKGQEQEAINICQSLIANKDVTIRQQAKQLLSILDAPSLPRPSNWSVQIPKIEIEPSLKSSSKPIKKKNNATTYPPTGPTKSLDLGFSILTLLIIIVITFLLSGCVEISTKLNITRADRLNISLDIASNSEELIPWQVEFAKNLSQENSLLKIQEENNHQYIESKPIRFEEVNDLFNQVTSAAISTSGFNINNPTITVKNKNWIIGSRQNLKFYFDLTKFPKIPGLRINVIINNTSKNNNFKSFPLNATLEKDLISLPIQIGDVNHFQVSYWKWNKISLGIILIILLTLSSTILQKFRLKLGFGFPELPP